MRAAPPDLTPGQRPRVSVITATFNAAQTLASCLRSVREQDYPSLEHIVVDGGSTDETVAILGTEMSNTFWISEPDRGIYDAWNKGIAMATGEWICFLGADDALLPSAIQAYMQSAKINPRAQYISSLVRWMSENGKTRLIGKAWKWSRFRRYMCTAHPGSMHHRSLFERYGRFDDSLKIVGDYEFLLRAGPDLEAAFLPEVTVEMKGGGMSDSLKALDEAKQVKVTTGNRRPWVAALERLVARQMFIMRRTFLQ